MSDREIYYNYGGGITLYAESAERWTSERYEIPRKYVHHPQNRSFWVQTPDGREFKFGSYSRNENRRKCLLMAELLLRIDDLKITGDPDTVPVSIAVAGRPAIAAYLHVAHNLTKEEISTALEVSRSTIEQYFSDFKTKRR